MMTDDDTLTERTRTAHGDAWQEQGRLRRPFGGDAVELPGIRLMASGIPHPQWNNGDVTDPSLVDLEAVRRWYADRQVPWGVRVPVGLEWGHGRHLFTKRLMALEPGDFQPATYPPGVKVRQAGPYDIDAVLAIDLSAFGGDPDLERRWIEPHLSAMAVTVALAELDGRPVGSAYGVRTDGRAGPALYLAGVAVLPEFRRQGIGSATSSWLAETGLASGAELVHLHPDDDAAAALYAGMGFVEVPGFDVYVDN